MNPLIEIPANQVAPGHRDPCVEQAHDKVLSQRDVESKEREDQQVCKVIDPKPYKHIDPRFYK